MFSLLVIWLHILAAVAWIGGMMFLSFVLVPVLKRDGMLAQRIVPFRAIAHRFRATVWGSVSILLGTGVVLVGQRGIALGDVASWPRILLVKLSLVLLLLILTLLHDVVIGPRVSQIMQTPEEARRPFDQALVLSSPWLPRISLVLALGVLLAASSLARP
jgi:copper resistance protein D